MTTSDQINEIAGALAKAQHAIKGAKKDSANPFFKSSYADLASVVDACREPLAVNGIAVVQAPAVAMEDGRVSVTTMLVHSSGQWMKETLSVKPKDDGPQAMGSVITYLRRYSLAAFAGVAPEDDDGNAAEGRKPGTVQNEVMRVEGKPSKGPLTVASVIKKETKRKNFFRWEVEFSDGRKAAFVNNDRMAALCESLAQDGREVDVVIERGEYGPELIEVVPVKQIESAAPVPAMAGQEQPF
jgi:hypothetical protein